MISHALTFADRFVSVLGLKNHLRPFYHALEDRRYGHALQPNAVLKNAYFGGRCFILGTGASLREIDLRLLRHEHTFGCNMIIKHEQLASLDLSFYTTSDTLLGLRKSRQPMERPEVLFPALERLFAGKPTLLFFNASCRPYLRSRGLLGNNRVFYLAPAKPMELAATQSNDLTRRITFMDGSLFVMMAAAIYMGFKELYLCGAGYTYQPFVAGHFYEDWQLVQPQTIDPKHRLMKQFADAHQVVVYNIVPDGFESPIYPKVSWEHVVDQFLTPPERGDLAERVAEAG